MRLCEVGDRSIAQVAKDLDSTETPLRNWVKRVEVDAGKRPVGALTTAKREELTRLQLSDATSVVASTGRSRATAPSTIAISSGSPRSCSGATAAGSNRRLHRLRWSAAASIAAAGRVASTFASKRPPHDHDAQHDHEDQRPTMISEPGRNTADSAVTTPLPTPAAASKGAAQHAAQPSNAVMPATPTRRLERTGSGCSFTIALTDGSFRGSLAARSCTRRARRLRDVAAEDFASRTPSMRLLRSASCHEARATS